MSRFLLLFCQELMMMRLTYAILDYVEQTGSEVVYVDKLNTVEDLAQLAATSSVCLTNSWSLLDMQILG